MSFRQSGATRNPTDSTSFEIPPFVGMTYYDIFLLGEHIGSPLHFIIIFIT